MMKSYGDPNKAFQGFGLDIFQESFLGNKGGLMINPNPFGWDCVSSFLIGISKLEKTSKHIFPEVLSWRIPEVC